MFVILLSIIILSVTVAFYFYAKKRNNYWRERGVSTVDTNFFFGVSFDFLTERRSLEQVHEDIYNAAGPDERFVGFYNLLKPGLLIRDPELIHQITIKDFSQFHDRQKLSADSRGRLTYSVNALQGEEWKSLRQKLVPIFSASKLKKMYNLVEECTDLLAEQHLRPAAQSGKPVNIEEIIVRYGLDVIGKCAFGLQFDSMRESESLYRRVGQTFTDSSGFRSRIRRQLLFDSKVLRMLGLKAIPDEVENFFFTLLRSAEELRRKETEHRGDFLQLMLDMKDENGDKTDNLFTDNHIASNMMIFYLAGHLSSSLPIAFAFYELAMHPELQEKLRREVDKARDANNGILDYDTLKRIAYLEMVVSETLRLHAPTGFMSRLCTTETYQIPGSSLKMREGDILTYSISGIHKDEKYFPNPHTFDPERFSPENIARMNPHVYQPFGTGPRMCLGAPFARLEIKICLASIISRFKVSRCDKTESPIILKKKGAFHAPENGIWLRVEEI